MCVYFLIPENEGAFRKVCGMIEYIIVGIKRYEDLVSRKYYHINKSLYLHLTANIHTCYSV